MPEYFNVVKILYLFKYAHRLSNGPQTSVWRLRRFFKGTQPTILCTENVMLLKWSTNECLVYGDCHGSSMVHNRLSRAQKMSCSFNGSHTSASCMEITPFFNGTQPTVLRTQNIMPFKWSTNECLVHADLHGSSMGHNRLYRVRRMSFSLNGSQTSVWCMEIVMLPQWNTNECLMHGECHVNGT